MKTGKRSAALRLIVGATLVVVSFFFLATPWGFPPSSVEYSDPRLPFAPLLLIIGGVIMWLAAVAFEIVPKKAAG
ncbi:MAG: hypothetical protein ACE5JE_00925 [Thermoplasmata archaeon]